MLNNDLGATWYVTREMPNDPPTPAQRDLLWHDLVARDRRRLPVRREHRRAAEQSSARLPEHDHLSLLHRHRIQPRHAAGVHRRPRELRRAHQQYWLPFDQLATLIPPKGYTALAAVRARRGRRRDRREVRRARRLRLGASARRSPRSAARPTASVATTCSSSGSIYWTPQLGAHEVHGRIRDAWAAAGWEAGPLGYPISDEYADGDGRRSDFEHGYIHWSAATDTTTIGP